MKYLGVYNEYYEAMTAVEPSLGDDTFAVYTSHK
jgi:hypothetical protein